MNRVENRRQQKLAKKLDHAMQHFTADRLPQAKSIYQQIRQTIPNHPVALHMLGVIAHQAGKDDIAIDLISQAVAIAPDYIDAHNHLGKANYELGKLDEAIASYRKALAIEPDFADAHNNLGIALQKQEKIDEAVASFRKALAIEPNNSGFHNNLGVVLLELKKIDEAVTSLHKALAIKPDNFRAHNNLGGALQQLGKMDEAVASFRKALAIKPDHIKAHNDLGNALNCLGRQDEAAASYRKALQLSPAFANGYYNLHALLLDPGDMAPAIECMKRAIDIDSHRMDYRFTMGMLLEYSGRTEDAAPHFDLVENGEDLDRAQLDAWRYIKSAHKKLPPITGSSIQALKLGLEAAVNDGLVLEFGVRFGTSIRQIAALADQEVYGFDSFEGLPEAWHNEPKGSYSTKGVIPTVPENVTLHKGWFEDTLPGFVEKYKAPVRFMNIDCDIYSATKTVLEQLAEQIIPGTVIVFDEYIGYEKWREDEFKAFQEAVLKHGWKYEYLGFSFMTKQVVVRIN